VAKTLKPLQLEVSRGILLRAYNGGRLLPLSRRNPVYK
jgi:hypothetical protein